MFFVLRCPFCKYGNAQEHRHGSIKSLVLRCRRCGKTKKVYQDQAITVPIVYAGDSGKLAAERCASYNQKVYEEVQNL